MVMYKHWFVRKNPKRNPCLTKSEGANKAILYPIHHSIRAGKNESGATDISNETRTTGSSNIREVEN
jgi:hypothetical protein